MPLPRRTYSTRNREFLKFASQGAGLGYIRNCVLDADSFDDVAVEEGGTVLKKIAQKGQLLMRITSGGAAGKYAPYDGVAVVAEGDMVVCADEIDLSYGDKPVGGYFLNCVFNTAGLVGYTGNEAEVQAAMPTCLFDE